MTNIELIQNFLKRYKLTDKLLKTYNEDILFEINNILNNNVKETYENDILYHYCGLFNQYKLRNINDAKKYYLLSLEKNNTNKNIMRNLASIFCYYKDYEQAKKYYLMAIDNGSIISIYLLANLYYKLLRDYENAKKYYLIAIEHKYIKAAISLGNMYKFQQDYENMLKYYTLAMENNEIVGYTQIMYYYIKLNDLENINKYYELGIDMYKDKTEVGIVYDYMRLYYTAIKDYDNAIKFLLMREEHCKKHNLINKMCYIYILINLYKLYKFIDNEKSLYYYKLCCDHVDQSTEKYNMYTYRRMGELCMMQSDIEKSIKYYKIYIKERGYHIFLKRKLDEINYYKLLLELKDDNKHDNKHDKKYMVEIYNLETQENIKIYNMNNNKDIGVCSVCNDDTIKLFPLSKKIFCENCYLKLYKNKYSSKYNL